MVWDLLHTAGFVIWLSTGAGLLTFSVAVLLGGGGVGEEQELLLQIILGYAMLVVLGVVSGVL